MLPYPAEQGSVPGHILHSSLKQKKKEKALKLNSPLGESIFSSTFDILTLGNDKQVDKTADTECKNQIYKCFIE